MKFFHFAALSVCLGVCLLVAACGGGGSNSGGSGGNNNTPQPLTVTSISPTSAMAGSGDLTLTVNGTGFTSSTVIQVDGKAEATTYIGSTQVTAKVPAAQLANGTNLSVVASNGSQSSGSGTVKLEVTNPAPTITSLSPSTQMLESTSLQETVTGTGFVSSSVINVNGTARTTAFTSATSVTVTLTAADVSAPGTLSLTAVNPAPGGGTSAAVSLAVNNPPIGPIHLSPSALVVGGTSPVTITITGHTFVPTAVAQVNGTTRASTYVNSSTLTFVATVADQATTGTFGVTVTNPAPGGGTSPVSILTIGNPTPTPIIANISPNTIFSGSDDTQIALNGIGFTADSTVQWNGTNLVTSGWAYSYYGSVLFATVPAADLATAGTATVTVTTPTSNPAVSNPATVTISDPPVPTITNVYPASGPIKTAAQLTLSGTGFTNKSKVAVNGVDVPVTNQGSGIQSLTQLTVNLPASSVVFPGNLNITVSTPPPGGGTSDPIAYTTYIPIVNNDMVYNAKDGLLYLSAPVASTGVSGNSVVGLDPATGNVIKEIWVGSNPNKLALSTDGTQIFVGLDGAAAVAQLDLIKGAVVNQFSLGGGPGVYNPPYTAIALAAVPGAPNSVAVSTTGGIGGGNLVAIFDSGVQRANTSSALNIGAGALSFGSSSSTLYSLGGSTVYKMTVDSTGISSGGSFYTSSSYQTSGIQYDSGRLYLSNGQVVDASTSALLGTFYASSNSPASGPIVSDSNLGRAFIGVSDYSSGAHVLAFDESSFNPNGSISANGINTSGYPSGSQRIARWGQDGIALTTGNQLFVFQSPVVKDLSALPADVSVSLSAPSDATTGTSITYTATVTNAGPNPADGVILGLTLDSSLIVNSIHPSQGTCGTGFAFTCDLGNLASGSSATVTVSATPTTAGTLAGSAVISPASYDPTTTNNQSTTSTTVTGGLYGAVPSIASISPVLVQAGSGDFTLTVNGNGFNDNSTVNLGSTALSTTYVSATQLTAAVTAAQIANYGWAAITVSNSAPGGGGSAVAPLTIYKSVNVPANGLAFDPFSQRLYASVPSAATTVTGNSIVTIDPATGTLGTPVPIGSEPDLLSETTDGNYIWVGLKGSNSLAQFDLLQQKLVATIPLTFTQYGTTTSTPATSLAAMPGSDSTLAVGMSNGWGNFGIFDVTGNTGTFRQNYSGIYSGVNPVWANSTRLYAYDSQTTGAEFYRYDVDASGLTLIDGTTLNGMGGFSGRFKLAGGLVYGASGGIANPSTTPPSQVARLSQPDFYQAGITPYGVAAEVDTSTRKEFLMLENTAGTWAYGLVRYDTTTYLPEAVINMPQSVSSILAGWNMFRWGQDGLAMLVSVNTQVDPQASSQILLLRGPFVTPQLLETHTKAVLSSSSSSTLAHGSGNTVLTLTGTNFLPGVAVTWNGTYRTTTIVDATHVAVAIPAADLSAAGTASVVATNPGAPASTALTITIN